MTPDLLTEAGMAMYGNQWRTPLAADLKVSERTLRRWAAGEFNIPPALREELAGIIEARGLALAAVRRKLRG